MKTKRVIKIIAIVLACIIAFSVLLVGAYVAYVCLQYYRIEDGQALEIAKSANDNVRTGESYTLVSYNTGFGAYSPEYTFFMDTGVMNDGRKVAGKYAKGMNKADVESNVSGALSVVREQNADFYFLQEIDTKAHRSYQIDMLARAAQTLSGYSYTFASNFHTAYLLYPFSDPMGTTNAGIATFFRFAAKSAVRRSFPLTSSFTGRLFDLDRCFAVHYFTVEGSDKELVLVNLHMSAYDEGGTVRAQQLAMLNAVLKEERDKGNYVIAGGDFNHCLIADLFESDEAALSHFESKQQVPDWVKHSVLHNAELAEGFQIAASAEISTCRGADIPYEKGVNYTTVIDGFLVSDNVRAVKEETVDTDYAYSDHNPVKLTFELIG